MCARADIAVLVYMIGVGGFILTQGVDANTFQDVAAALNSTSADSALDALLVLGLARKDEDGDIGILDEKDIDQSHLGRLLESESASD